MRRARGFKLLEVMVATALFFTVAVLFLNLLPASFWATKKANNLHTSHMIMTSEFERLRHTAFGNLVAGTSEPESLRRNGTDFSFTVDIQNIPGRDPDLLKRVEIVVQWKEQSGDKKAQMTSYLTSVKR